MQRIPDGALTTPLVIEHEYLGADFQEFGDIYAPAKYSNAKEELTDALQTCGIADLSAIGMIDLTGDGVAHFLNTMTTVATFDMVPGEARAGLILTGQGEIIDAAVVLKVANDNFKMFNSTGNIQEAQDWLSAHANIERDGVRPFKDVTVTEATGTLQIILATGPSTLKILSDFTITKLPAAGMSAGLVLDDKPATLVCLPEDIAKDTYLIIMPLKTDSGIWRALLSFTEVTPIGMEAVQALFEVGDSNRSKLFKEAYVTPEQAGLKNLLRDDNNFVGARALHL